MKRDLKKSRALTIMSSWLSAVKIPHEVDIKQGVFLIGGKRVNVLADNEVQPQDGVSILAKDLTAPLEHAVNAFNNVTESVGFGRPQPVDRGSRRCTSCSHPLNVEDEKCQNCKTDIPDRIRFTNSPELVAMRHSEFRQVSNPPHSVYQDGDYQRIMKWYCINFYRKNMRLCQGMGYDINDLMTYAMIYLANFWGKWRHLDATPNENGKMFCGYLNQRFFGELLSILKRKSRNILVDEETVDMGNNVYHVPQFENNSGTNLGRDGMYLETVKGESEPEYEAILANMPHDDHVELLAEAIKKRGVRANVKNEAIRRLSEHWLHCFICDPFSFELELKKFSHVALVALMEGLGSSETIRSEVKRDAQKRLKLHGPRGMCPDCTTS